MPPITTYDPDYARGSRGPGPVVGKGAWANILEIRRRALAVEKLLRQVLLDTEEKEHCLRDFDSVMRGAEALLLRYDRNGPPEIASEIIDMEATIRLSTRYPDHFKAFDVEGLKKQVTALRKKGVVC